MALFKKKQHVDPRMIPLYSYTNEATGKKTVGLYSQVRGFTPFFDQRGAGSMYDEVVLNDDNKEIGTVKRISEIRGNRKGYVPNDPLAIYAPNSGKFTTAARAMEAHFGWVYACAKAIADEMANVEFKLYSVNSKGEHEEELEHEVLDFLDMVNDFQTGPEFKHMVATHLELAGNAYILLEGVKSFTDKPKAMYLLDPGKVKVILNTITYPFKIERYEFTYESRKFIYQPYEIIQLKYPDPSNPYVGLGTVQGIAEWIDNDNHTTMFLKQFFKNGASLNTIFETEMTSIEQLETLRDSFDEQHAGIENAYKAMFLPKGVKQPKVNETKLGDIGITGLSDSYRDMILAGFRVSKTILGTAESDTNRSTAETADYVFSKRTIKPKMQLIVSYLNEFLLPRFAKTDKMYLAFIDPVPEDKAFRTTEMQAVVNNMPIMTVNEARQEFMGLGPIEGGEKLMKPTTQAPADEITPTSTEPMPTKAIKSAKKVVHPGRIGKTRSRYARSSELRQEAKKSLADKILDVITSTKKKGITEMTDEEYVSIIHKDSVARMSTAEEKLKAEFRKINSAQKDEVIKNLPNATKMVKKTKAIDPTKLFDMKTWIALTVDATTPSLTTLFKDESSAAATNVGAPGIDVIANPTSADALAASISLMSTSYNQTTLDLLASKLDEGLSNGLSLAELTATVQDIYEFQDAYAAERIAKTETVRISNMANKDAWQQAGTVKTVKWYTSLKDNVCPFCQAQNGKTISVDDNFFDQGDTMTLDSGESLSFDYSDVGGPPLHPNCGCLIRPYELTPISAGQPDPDDALLDAALKDIKKDE